MYRFKSKKLCDFRWPIWNPPSKLSPSNSWWRGTNLIALRPLFIEWLHSINSYVSGTSWHQYSGEHFYLCTKWLVIKFEIPCRYLDTTYRVDYDSPYPYEQQKVNHLNEFPPNNCARMRKAYVRVVQFAPRAKPLSPFFACRFSRYAPTNWTPGRPPGRG